MKLTRSSAEIFIPDGTPVRQALARTTHLCIAAHHDDIEIMAPSFILACYGRRTRWFTGVVATDGAGSPRAGRYARYSDAQMRAVRRREQKKAARLGKFGAALLLDHPSASVKDPRQAKGVRQDIRELVLAARPEVMITHNLADKHDTHVALSLRVVETLRSLPPEARPRKLYGGEVWRDLDWMLDSDKVLWDVSERTDLQAKLLRAFDSQVSGGKRYDLAAAARRRACATYTDPRSVDAATGLSVAMDMTPLIRDTRLDPVAYTEGFVERFKRDVRKRIARWA
jgi:LmbE family N-acetylglucosaminyl deacetylase